MHCVEGVAPHEQRINVEAMISAGQKLIIFSPNDAVEKLLKSFYHIDDIDVTASVHGIREFL